MVEISTDIRQAIVTRYLGPTNVRGSRIKSRQSPLPDRLRSDTIMRPASRATMLRPHAPCAKNSTG